ncbi:MAG: hypothetical protein WCH44_03550 [Betaproteobacteria bacterium]
MPVGIGSLRPDNFFRLSLRAKIFRSHPYASMTYKASPLKVLPVLEAKYGRILDDQDQRLAAGYPVKVWAIEVLPNFQTFGLINVHVA